MSRLPRQQNRASLVQDLQSPLRVLDKGRRAVLRGPVVKLRRIPPKGILGKQIPQLKRHCVHDAGRNLENPVLKHTATSP